MACMGRDNLPSEMGVQTRTHKEKEHGDLVIQDKARPALFSDLSKAKVKEGHATRQVKVSKI